jgi:crotonobetainyl-CoA:carnitine CoA-transferase CaiB-like acyl-CoA transferase
MTDFNGRTADGASQTSTDRRPLSTVRILDLTDEAVALAPRLLADLGATVYRLEPPAGDRLRSRGPFVDGTPGVERSLAHVLYNAGKKSVALNLGREEAQGLIEKLAESVDVVMAPLAKPAPIKLLLEELRRHKADQFAVVDVVLRRDSPEMPATDLIGAAAGGLLYLNGFPDDPPNLPAGKLAYKQASLAVALAAMTLVTSRTRGKGSGWITVSMQEAVMLTTIQTGNENYWHWHRTRPARGGLGALGGRSIYQAADGLWVSFTIPPPYWDAYARWVVEVTGRTHLLDEMWRDPRFRLIHAAEIAEMTAAVCALLPREQLVEGGQERHLLVLPVNSVRDVANDPHLRARGFFEDVSYPQLRRSLTMPVPPFLSNRYPRRAARAPMLGEHTVEALRDLAQLNDAAIAKLLRSGTVHQLSTANIV